MKQKLLQSVRLRAAMLVALICAAFTGQVWADTKTVTLTQSALGLTGSYTTNTEKTIDEITYVYTDLMKSNDNIQAKASSGVLYNKTAYPGDITSVAITHSGTARSTTIFGSTDGTNWVQVATGSGSITGDFSGKGYKYFKITRGSNAAYWTQVVVTYSPAVAGTTAAPTINGAEAFFTTREVSITNAASAEGATIYYTTDGTEPTTESAQYTKAFTINATTTVKAIAKADDDDNASSVVSKTFTKETVLNGMSTLAAQTNTSDASYYVSLTDAQVTYVNGKNGYLEDATGGAYIYNISPTLNKVYNGVFQITYQLYNKMPEVKGITAVEGTITDGSTWTPVSATADELETSFSSYLGRQVAISNYTVTSASALTENIAFYTTYLGSSLTTGKTYNLIGYPYNNNGTLQFRLISAEEKTREATVITVDGGTSQSVDRNNGVEELTLTATASGNQTVSFSIANSTLTEDTDFAFENGDFLFYTAKAGTITVTATTEGNEDYLPGEETITIAVLGTKANAVIGYDGLTGQRVKVGSTYVIDPELIEGGDITVTSSDEEVASVEGLTITGVANGTATITISTAASNVYNAGSGTFQLTVYTPAASDLALTPVALSFDLYSNADAQVIHYTTSGTGAVTVGTSDYATFAVDAEAKTITVTPTATTTEAQTITVSQAADDDYQAGEVTFTLSVDDTTPAQTFELVTSVSELNEGDVVTLVDKAKSLALGAKRTNNYGAVDISSVVSGNAFTYQSSNEDLSGITFMTIEKSGNYCYFKIANGTYLSSTSNTSNYMGTAGQVDAAKASVSISEGLATITFQSSSNSHNTIRSNYSSSIFSCYVSSSTTGNAPSIYKKAKLANSITATTAYTLDLTEDETSLTLSATCTATDGTVTYAVKSATMDDRYYILDAATGELTVDEDTPSGEIVITASCAETTLYKAAEDVDITVTVVGKTKSDATFDLADAETPYGTPYTVDDSKVSGGDITVTSSNTAVATVSGLTVTPVAVGTTTITVSTAETALYNAGSTTFQLTVTAPEGKTTAYESKYAIAQMDFTSNAQWGLPTDYSTTEETYTSGDNSVALTGSYKFGNSYLMLQSGSTLTFQAFGKKVTEIEVIGNSGASGKTTENIYVGETAVSTETTGSTGTNTFAINENYQSVGTTYQLQVSSANAQITGINVYTEEALTATLNASGYTTFCSAYPLDFSAAEGYTAWQVTGVEGEVITFSKVTGAVRGGTGLLLMGEAGATVTLTSTSSTEELSGNLLAGTLAPTYVATDEYYGLKGNEFVKVNAGTVPAGKALLPVSALGGGDVKAFTLRFLDATGIQTTRTLDTTDNTIYNLAGQRLGKMQKGINIVGGKKVVVR